MGEPGVVLRTLDEIRAAGAEFGRGMPPLSDVQVDRVATLLAPLPPASPPGAAEAPVADREAA